MIVTSLITFTIFATGSQNNQMGIFYHKKAQNSPLPFKSEELEHIASQFCLNRAEIHKFYQCFTSFQTSLKSYLTLDDMVETLHHGSPNFAQLPYLQRLFFLISKKTPGKIFFEDYLTGISTFCLMNTEAILHFVFDWLDNDCDERITIEDITSASEYKNPKTNQQTFFCNFIPDIEKIGINRTNRLIKFEDFRQHSNTILFIIWPAYQLQEKMREMNLGSEFWKKQYIKISNSEMLLKNSEKKAFRMLDKIRLLSTIKVNRQVQFTSIHEEQKSRKKGKIMSDIQLLEVQKPKRRNSCPYIKGQITSKQILQEESD